MASTTSELFGSCACERNQYTILVPTSSTTQAQVFFDNSAENRRSQATPLTAWLRVPLAWYHSRTFAQFPDESHASIRRTFHTPVPSSASTASTRRQFCGYCGTHLSAWDEGQGGHEDEVCMDITLGSLLDESLRELETLGVLADSDEDEVGTPADDDDLERADVPMSSDTETLQIRNLQAPQPMRNRGMPFFESMVENSRLGRIKRQKGGHTSRDGRRTVEWEVVEMDDGGAGEEAWEDRSKRPRLEP